MVLQPGSLASADPKYEWSVEGTRIEMSSEENKKVRQIKSSALKKGKFGFREFEGYGVRGFERSNASHDIASSASLVGGRIRAGVAG